MPSRLGCCGAAYSFSASWAFHLRFMQPWSDVVASVSTAYAEVQLFFCCCGFAAAKEAAKDGKVVIAQIAPAVRVAIAETMGLGPGEVTVGQMVTGLRQLGFDYVFGEFAACAGVGLNLQAVAAFLRYGKFVNWHLPSAWLSLISNTCDKPASVC